MRKWILVASRVETENRFEYLICAPVEINPRFARFEVFGRTFDYAEAQNEVERLNRAKP